MCGVVLDRKVVDQRFGTRSFDLNEMVWSVWIVSMIRLVPE